jgi:hypothetical protein
MSAETQAMQEVESVLEALEPEARKRIISWVAQKYGFSELNNDIKAKPPRAARKRKGHASAVSIHQNEGARIPIKAIANLIRSHEHAEMIEQNILDRRDLLNRILLPLFVVHKNMNDQSALTAQDIVAVLKHLNVSIAPPNVTKVLRRESGFVIHDPDEHPKRFKLSRKGIARLEEVLRITRPDVDKIDEQAIDSPSNPAQEELDLNA